MLGKQWGKGWAEWKGGHSSHFLIVVVLFLTIPQTNKLESQPSVSTTALCSYTWVSFLLDIVVPLGLGTSSRKLQMSRRTWLMDALFCTNVLHISMQCLLGNFLDVEFLSKYTVSPLRARNVPVNDPCTPCHRFLNRPRAIPPAIPPTFLVLPWF